ncbi:RNA polymerase sigma factor [Chitinophaga sancti]|uniref:RNA polymerase sigma-70 factor n=1 Tax=Chitinophaga sancti TaxID=1004 RepID=A0A1K1RB87_9BACT|nr:RNA polymerase sigma-70 factor [Chitinophaga sancti]WQD65589.1 RNA polymerase sigma-70 factor [Chitinophaga sancti]WQG88788.1 RNA polymerase sigma-70 factor [Chitinophaga sancti]SFW69514.1 RNA polymerase sigma-70 factor, ECF subfamily [Chitinophaga sancti]
MQPTTDTELLQQLRKGNESAFRQLYDRHSRQVAAFIYQLTHSAVDAEDILQDTFLKLWTSRDQLPAIENIGNYIFIIARNKTVDHLRKVARQQQLVDQVWANISEVADALDLQLDARESQQLISNALSQLSTQKQTIFRLSRVEGLSHEDIAAQMGLSKSRVKNLQVETLKHIRVFLSRYGGPLGVLLFTCLMKS